MFDWLGTFVSDQFTKLTQFIETIDGGKKSSSERLEHLGKVKSRHEKFLGYMRAIDSRRMAGTQLRWKEEPTPANPGFKARPAKDDSESSQFIMAMKYVWHRFLWHKKDEASYNWLKCKDRVWQLEQEMSDVIENVSNWGTWKSKVQVMLGNASLSTKVYRCLTHKNDDQATY